MNSFLLFIKRVFYKLGIDISFVRKEELRSAIEINDVDTINKAWSDKKISKQFLSKPVLARYHDTLSVLKDHQIELAGKSIIDVGCGNGMLLKFLAENFAISSQTGMEYAEAAVEVARKINPEADYLVHDINEPFSSSYDVVFCTEVLEHILDPANAIQNLLDMAGNDGVLFITVPNGRIDTFSGHINFWSPESWEFFIAESSGALKHCTGEAAKGLMYAIVYNAPT